MTEQFFTAVDLYNRGEFLQAQELLEGLYPAAEPDDQPLVRGIMMIACGMHLHFHRGGGRGALNLLRQSLLALDDYRPRRLGLEVDELCEALEAYLKELQDRRTPGAGFFDRWLVPRIRYRQPGRA